MGNSKEKLTLRSDVAAKYELSGIAEAGELQVKLDANLPHKTVHLSRIGLVEADKLVSKGFKFLKLKPAASADKKSS